MIKSKLYRKLLLSYFRYKDAPYFHLSLYTGIVIISLLLVWLVLIPQVNNLFSLNEEVAVTRENIETITSNTAYLRALDKGKLNDDFLLASAAYPPERDVASLLTAINTSAANAGVLLDDFSFQVGEVFSKSTEDSKSVDGAEAKITFIAEGNVAQINQLLSELHQKIPLLTITGIDAIFSAKGKTQISVVYYFKAYPLIKDTEVVPLTSLTANHEKTLEALREWEEQSGMYEPVETSNSADLTPL